MLNLIWIIPLGVALIGVAWFFVSIAFRLGSTLKSIERTLDKEISPLLKSVDRTVVLLNDELPILFENVNEISKTIQQISENEMQGTLKNVQEMSDLVNQNMSKIDELVSTISEFSEKTIDRMTFYRNQMSIPITDLISLWSGIKAGWENFRKRK